MKMKYLTLFVIFFIICFINIQNVSAEFTSISHWDSLTGGEGGWACQNHREGSLSIDKNSGTPDPSNALRIKYPVGLNSGSSPAHCWNMFPSNVNEFWIQYNFKYSSNYEFHGTDNKQTYYYVSGDGNNDPNWYISTNGSRHINMITQTYATNRYRPNTGYDPIIEPGRWYNLTAHFIINNPGVNNGVAQIWIDNKMVMDHRNIGYRSSTESAEGFTSAHIQPVFGGMGSQTKTAEDYQYYDYIIISTKQPPSFNIPPVLINNKAPAPPSGLTID